MTRIPVRGSIRAMSPLYLIALALLAALPPFATLAKGGSIRQKIQGEIDFTPSIALTIAGMGAGLTALIAQFADSFSHAVFVAILAALWHWGALKITTGFLQRVAIRVNP